MAETLKLILGGGRVNVCSCCLEETFKFINVMLILCVYTGFSSPVSGGAACFRSHMELLQRDLHRTPCAVKNVESMTEMTFNE